MDIKKAIADFEAKKTPQEKLDLIKSHTQAVNKVLQNPAIKAKLMAPGALKEQVSRYTSDLKSIQAILEKIVAKNATPIDETQLKNALADLKGLAVQIAPLVQSL